MLGEDAQTLSFRGRRSRNKVSVGEPAEGSLSFLHPHRAYRLQASPRACVRVRVLRRVRALVACALSRVRAVRTGEHHTPPRRTTTGERRLSRRGSRRVRLLPQRRVCARARRPLESEREEGGTHARRCESLGCERLFFPSRLRPSCKSHNSFRWISWHEQR